jgi:hypothetical protein
VRVGEKSTGRKILPVRYSDNRQSVRTKMDPESYDELDFDDELEGSKVRQGVRTHNRNKFTDCHESENSLLSSPIHDTAQYGKGDDIYDVHGRHNRSDKSQECEQYVYNRHQNSSKRYYDELSDEENFGDDEDMGPDIIFRASSRNDESEMRQDRNLRSCVKTTYRHNNGKCNVVHREVCLPSMGRQPNEMDDGYCGVSYLGSRPEKNVDCRYSVNSNGRLSPVQRYLDEESPNGKDRSSNAHSDRTAYRSSVECRYCRRKGHFRDECRKLTVKVNRVHLNMN